MNKDSKFHNEFINKPIFNHGLITSKNSKSINYTYNKPLKKASRSTHCSYISTIHAPADTKVNHDNKLSKRIRSKFVNEQFIFHLIDLDSPLKDNYWDTYWCASSLVQKGYKIKAKSYCKNRWCLVCNRIKTASMILSYGEELNKIENKAFLTLSRVNVPKERLSAEISLILKDFGKIINSLERRGRGKKIKGIRKLEVTYNVETNEYHPHLHGIFSIEDATRIKKAWFDLCNKQGFKVSHKANQIVAADDNSILEVFKYCTKLFKIDRQEKDEHGRQIINVDIKPLDTIFQSLKGRRTFSAFGIKKKKVDLHSIDQEEYTFLDFKFQTIFWNKYNYFNEDGQPLTKDNHARIYNVKIR